jgi:hypothetical protein
LQVGTEDIPFSESIFKEYVIKPTQTDPDDPAIMLDDAISVVFEVNHSVILPGHFGFTSRHSLRAREMPKF